MSRLGHTRDKIYKTVARQLHGVVPCWVCGEHVLPAAATLEHIQPLSQGGSSHQENLAISHEVCNGQRHATGRVPASDELPGQVRRTASTPHGPNMAQNSIGLAQRPSEEPLARHSGAV